jgi:hypothetical protein
MSSKSVAKLQPVRPLGLQDRRGAPAEGFSPLLCQAIYSPRALTYSMAPRASKGRIYGARDRRVREGQHLGVLCPRVRRRLQQNRNQLNKYP